ncbi:hypothetical protein Tco_0399920 [Tanacetum coccineum]
MRDITKQDQLLRLLDLKKMKEQSKRINEQVAVIKEKEQKSESSREEVQEEEGAKKGKILRTLDGGPIKSLTEEDLKLSKNLLHSDFWDEQLNWKIISWKLHSSSGVHTIMTSNGLVIHMLVENRYPLTKEVLSQLLDLKLETEEDSTMALELIKFVTAAGRI